MKTMTKLGYLAAHVKQVVRDKLVEHRQYITRYGEDMPEIAKWRWSNFSNAPARRIRGKSVIIKT